MNDLFPDLPESKSPKLLWTEENQISIKDNGIDFKPGEECPETGAQLYRYLAYVGDDCGVHWDHLTGWGDTEMDALLQLVKKRKLKLWNQ